MLTFRTSKYATSAYRSARACGPWSWSSPVVTDEAAPGSVVTVLKNFSELSPMVWASGGKEYHHGGLTGGSRSAGVTGGFRGTALGVTASVVAAGPAALSSPAAGRGA